jgi:hypothetical protein
VPSVANQRMAFIHGSRAGPPSLELPLIGTSTVTATAAAANSGVWSYGWREHDWAWSSGLELELGAGLQATIREPAACRPAAQRHGMACGEPFCKLNLMEPALSSPAAGSFLSWALGPLGVQIGDTVKYDRSKSSLPSVVKC